MYKYTRTTPVNISEPKVQKNLINLTPPPPHTECLRAANDTVEDPYNLL